MINEEKSITDPYCTFIKWLKEATKVEKNQAIAAVLATSYQNTPSCRVVLVKKFDQSGFYFHTNLGSRKAQEISVNKNVSLCFYWGKINKQIRIEGSAEQISDHEADDYFRSRPRGHQISAWCSQQSEILSSKNILIQSYKKVSNQFLSLDVPRPPFWSGFKIIPNSYEFWQEQENRLHTRIYYKRQIDNKWKKNFLYP